jgi:hypothetical protein
MYKSAWIRISKADFFYKLKAMSLALLFLVSQAWAADTSPPVLPEARDWATHMQYQGGALLRAKPPAQPASEEAMLRAMGPAATDPTSFEAFRNAYNFAYSIPAVGGMDLTWEDSLDFAFNFAGDHAKDVQKFKTSFYDRMTKLPPGAAKANVAAVIRTTKDDLLTRMSSGKALPGPSWKDKGVFEKAVRTWAQSPDSVFGGGFSGKQAELISKYISAGDHIYGDGSERFAAFREVYNLMCAKVLAGGMQQCGPGRTKLDQVAKIALKVVEIPGSLERVQALRAKYHKELLDYRGNAVRNLWIDNPEDDPRFAEAWRAAVEDTIGSYRKAVESDDAKSGSRPGA